VPVYAEEEPTHIGVADEYDAEEVVDLAFVQPGDVPQVGNGVQHRLFAVCGGGLDGYHVVVAR